MTRNSQGTVDPLDFSTVLERQTQGGVKLTFTVSTDVTGQDDRRSVLALKNQVREAKSQLLGSGVREPDATALLEPVAALVEDSSYWRLQSRGLVVFLDEEFFLPVRVPLELTDSLSVGDVFNLLPLAPVLASDRRLYVLALAQNSVRLFDSSRNVIEQLPLENVPASFAEVVDELPERVVDVRAGSAGPGGTASYHGPDGDIDRMMLEKYIHAVGQELGKRLGTDRSQLLVLAAVAEYLPIFKSSCPYPAIFDGVIAGNPEQALPDDLRSDAWRLVNAHETSQETEEQDRARSLAHSGKGSFDLVEIARAAEEGRVDTLYLPRDTGQINEVARRDLANLALSNTLRTSGVLRTLERIEDPAIATFRY